MMKYEEKHHHTVNSWVCGAIFPSSSFQMMGNQPIRMRISLIITTRTGSSQVFAWFLLGYWGFLHLVVNNTPWKNHRSKFIMILKLASEKKIIPIGKVWWYFMINWKMMLLFLYQFRTNKKTLKHIDSIPPPSITAHWCPLSKPSC